MSLAQALYPYIAACFTGIWIESHEHEDAIAELRNLCREHDWSCASWDLDRGLRIVGQGEQPAPATTASDPVAALRAVNSLASAPPLPRAPPDEFALVRQNAWQRCKPPL